MPRSRIYRRLGFHKDTTRLTDSQRNEIDAYIDDARSLIRLQGTGRRLQIHDIQASSIFLPDGLVLKSGNLADFLRGCTGSLSSWGGQREVKS